MARVLLFSERHAESRMFHAQQYEFEDVIERLDDVHVLAPRAASAGPIAQLARRAARKASRTAGRARPITDPIIEPATVSGEYDLFFAVLHFANDVAHLERLRGIRERCDKAVCFFLEMYDDGDLGLELQALKEFGFDQVFLFNPRPADRVRREGGAPADFMPVGVDALRFTPYPSPPQRSIDLYAFGRRSETLHRTALDLADRDGRFYLYDTVRNTPWLHEPLEHRRMTAEIIKRTRYFFAYRAAEDVERAAEDDDLSSRYFEGTAGGAVLLGSSPRTAEYRECFPWDDATIEIPYDPENLRDILADLEAQPERLARARMHNVLGALRRHDWSYRWARVLGAAGLEPTARLRERHERLEELAGLAEQHEGAELEPLCVAAGGAP